MEIMDKLKNNIKNELDVDALVKSLDNEDNVGLLNLDLSKIKSIKNDILQKLGLSREKLKKIHIQLKEYRYVDELPDIKYGSYIRWISLKDPSNIKLTNGGFICDIKIDDKGIHIVCRNNMNRFFQLCMSESLIFQKLNDQEKILLSVLGYLNE